MNDYDISLPWGDGTTDHIYLKIDPDSEEIGVYSDVNNTGITRSKNLVFFGSSSQISGSQQAKAVLHVVQQINSLVVATFENTVSTYVGIGSGNYV